MDPKPRREPRQVLSFPTLELSRGTTRHWAAIAQFQYAGIISSATPDTPGTLCAKAVRAFRSASEPTNPHRCTVPFCTVMLRLPKSVQCCCPNKSMTSRRMTLSDSSFGVAISSEEARAWMRLDRLTIPTSFPSRTMVGALCGFARVLPRFPTVAWSHRQKLHALT